MTHKQVEGSPIGEHPLVTRLLKGVYNRRPPQPHYSTTWDVDVVTKHLATITMGLNESLSLKKLSQKLVVLMALVEASKTLELRALHIRFRTYRWYSSQPLPRRGHQVIPLRSAFWCIPQ